MFYSIFSLIGYVVKNLQWLCWMWIMVFPLMSNTVQCQTNLDYKFEYIGVNEGLNSTRASQIYEDRQGFIWICNGFELQRYDGYHFKNYSIQDNTVVICIAEDGSGDYWIGTNQGLFLLDTESDNIQAITDTSGQPINDFVISIKVTPEQDFYLLYQKWGIYSIYIENRMVRPVYAGSPSDKIYKSFDLDEKGNVWLATDAEILKVGKGPEQTHHLKNIIDSVSLHLFYHKNHVFLATTNGLLLYDIINDEIHTFRTIPTDPTSLINNIVHKICPSSRQNSVWVVSLGGVGLFNINDYSFHWLSDNVLGDNFAIDLLDDSNGILWVNSLMTGINKSVGRSRHFNLINHLSPSGTIQRLNLRTGHMGQQKRIWLGSQSDGLFLIEPGKKSEQILYSGPDQHYRNRIRAVLEDGDSVWLGTNNGGLGVYDTKRKRFVRFYDQFEDGLAYNGVWSLAKDKMDRIWIGTQLGLSIFDKKHRKFTNLLAGKNVARIELFEKEAWIASWSHGAIRYLFEQDSFVIYNQENGLPTQFVNCITKDKSGFIWIGTGRGFSKLDPKTGEINNYYLNNPKFPYVGINDIGIDKDGILWIVSGRVVSKFDPNQEEFILHLQEEINLTGIWFGFFDDDGLLNVGGGGGLVQINTSKIHKDTITPKVYFISAKLNGQESINLAFTKARPTYNIKLKHSQNNLQLEFVGIFFKNPQLVNYQFRFKGENDWNNLGNSRTIFLNNLQPGKHEILVRASNQDGIWSNNPAIARIEILPPWWQSWWAWTLYIFSFGFLFWGILFFQGRRERLKAQLALQQQEAEKEKEMNQTKTRIYTNITHEFRTPLTVISGMTEQILKAPAEWAQKGSKIIQRNTSQMLQLVNQLLDLRKLEVGSLEYHPVHSDVLVYLKYLSESFDSMARSKEVELHFLNEVPEIHMDFDPDKIQRIFSNLLSNAVKFTPSGGHVYVQTNRIHLEEKAWFQLKIRDTGIGIAPEEIPHIFDRFYQANDSSTRQAEGTGIGLALTQELVRFLHGTIEVQSQLGTGTSFVVQLPIKEEAEVTTLPFDKKTATILPLADSPVVQPPEPTNTDALPTLLVIEDNADVVTYIQATLESSYNIEVAFNGAQGIEQAIVNVPDLIISDVMMPEKDGFEVCATLKKDRRTSHIPIILLTAKADDTSRLQGLEHGADAYLSKPFRQDELKIRLRKLLQLRQALQQKYAQLAPIEPDQKEELSPEERFLYEARSVVELHLDDPEFGPTQLQRALGVSRTQLFNKLKALTGRSASSFIRGIRLQYGRRLLQTTDKTVAEVTYAVGLGDPNYFSRCYRKEFGVRPSTERDNT